MAVIAEAVYAMLRSRALEKGIELRIVGHDVGAPTLIGDSTRLNQVLVNIIENAIKFTDEGCVTAHFCQTSADDSSESLRIEVRDTGIGIPASELERVFERFHQVDSSSHRSYGGMGLGLSIARDLVEAMGGSIAIESKVGVGTCVTISFMWPRAVTELWETPVDRPADVRVATDGPAGTALVVDDNYANRALTRRFLELGNWSVVEAADGPSALAQIEADHFDVVLMDVEMPGMDGFETARRIARKSPCSTHSSSSSTSRRQWARNPGSRSSKSASTLTTSAGIGPPVEVLGTASLHHRKFRGWFFGKTHSV